MKFKTEFKNKKLDYIWSMIAIITMFIFIGILFSQKTTFNTQDKLAIGVGYLFIELGIMGLIAPYVKDD